MKALPTLILHAAFVFLALQFVPRYGDLVAGLFDRVADGLGVAQRSI